MDYARLIDDETWAFIRRMAKRYPDDAVEMSIDDQRRVYDVMCRDFRQPRPPGVKFRTETRTVCLSAFILQAVQRKALFISMVEGSSLADWIAMTTFAPRSAPKLDTASFLWTTGCVRNTGTPRNSRTAGLQPFGPPGYSMTQSFLPETARAVSRRRSLALWS